MAAVNEALGVEPLDAGQHLDGRGRPAPQGRRGWRDVQPGQSTTDHGCDAGRSDPPLPPSLLSGCVQTFEAGLPEEGAFSFLIDRNGRTPPSPLLSPAGAVILHKIIAGVWINSGTF